VGEDASGTIAASTYLRLTWEGAAASILPCRYPPLTMPSPDPFPRERFTALLRRLPAYARLAWRLAREPVLSRARRAAVVAAAGYLASPIDAVPGVIPVLGQLDDLAVALAAIRFALAGLDAERRAGHLAAVGLSDADVGDDLRAVGTTTAWLVRAGMRGGWRVGRAIGRLGVRGAVGVVRGARGPLGRVVRRDRR